MRAIIREQVKEVPVTTVILQSDVDDQAEERLKMFFCYNCQNPVAQYNGHVFAIMPGKSPVSLPVYIKCPNCKKLYSIQGII